jgi:hypothetical protein
MQISLSLACRRLRADTDCGRHSRFGCEAWKKAFFLNQYSQQTAIAAIPHSG